MNPDQNQKREKKKTIMAARLMKRETMEDLGLILGLIMVQFVYAGNSVLMSYLMSTGIEPLTLVIFTAFATFLVLSPFAIIFERSKWPKKITLKLVIQLFFISFAGVTLFQSFFLKGIELTSPAIATAMPNLAPGLIFIIAWTCRLEKVKLSCRYSKVKIMGTILCVIGAIMMSILQNSMAQDSGQTTSSTVDYFDREKITGCVYLLAAVFVLSSNVVVQAVTLGDFPAPISLCALTSLVGGIITLFVQVVQDPMLLTSWPLISLRKLLCYSLLAGTISGACVSFNGWAMKKRGPVLVSMFCPIATVLSVIISVITLGASISIGSFAGMCLMFTGLYFVLWAKRKEDLSGDVLRSEFDSEKPLLG